MIEFKQVEKRFGPKTVLKPFSLSLPKGKIIGVIGSNGSGKTTFLQLINGLNYPTRGTVKVDGERADRRISRKIAFLSEKNQLYPFYTVRQTIDFYASQYADFNVAKALEILDFMKLDPLMKVSNLSKGYRGRFKMVLVLAREVPWILMDEPLSGLDPMVRDSIIRSLVTFVDPEKQSVILTTHEISEIEPILDLVVAIRDGEILCVSNAEDIRQREQASIEQWMKKVY